MNDSDSTACSRRPRRWSLTAALRRMSPEGEASWRDAVKLIDGMAGDDPAQELSAHECRILKSRWIGQTVMYEHLWRSQRGTYYLLRIPIILGATTIPVLASLSAPKLVTAAVGLVVAVLTALDSFFQFGSRWQRHRQAATELGFRGWEFLELSGTFAKKSRREAYAEFITGLEALNKRQATAYMELFRPAGDKDEKK
jgi:hypothetical protein